MSEWREVSLGEVADLLVGYAFKSSDFSENEADVRLLRGVNIGQGGLEWGRIAYWSIQDAEGSRYLLEEGDIVLAMDRPWIEAGLKRARLREEDLPALLVQRVTRLRGTSVARASFLHHLIASETFARYIQTIVTGATIPHVSQTQIGTYRFALPSIPEQDRICEILDALDDLIENNRRRIELLEQMAQAIYREWFVHFRYPGHEDATLVDSPLGPIPEGWHFKPLGTLATLDRTSIQPRRSPDEAFHHYSLPAFDDGKLPVIDAGETIKSGKFLLVSSAVLVSKLNPKIERTWFVEPVAHRRSVGSTEFLVLRPCTGYSLEFLYLLARSGPFRERLRELSGGTSTSHQRAKPDDFLRIDIVAPPAVLAGRLAEAVASPLRMARLLCIKNQQLAGIRDLLLPKLVTGQIDVSKLDLDALTESVA